MRKPRNEFWAKFLHVLLYVDRFCVWSTSEDCSAELSLSFFPRDSTSDDDEEYAFTCLSRATGGVWHDLSRVANLPEDLDAVFFSGAFSSSAFAKSVSGCFCLSVTPLLSLPLVSLSSSSSSSLPPPRRDEADIPLDKCALPWLSSTKPCDTFLHRRRSLLVAKRLLATCTHDGRLRDSREVKRIETSCRS